VRRGLTPTGIPIATGISRIATGTRPVTVMPRTGPATLTLLLVTTTATAVIAPGTRRDTMDTVSAALPVVWHDAPTTVADGVISPRWTAALSSSGAPRPLFEFSARTTFSRADRLTTVSNQGCQLVRFTGPNCVFILLRPVIMPSVLLDDIRSYSSI
jgi:hypothetical protein